MNRKKLLGWTRNPQDITIGGKYQISTDGHFQDDDNCRREAKWGIWEDIPVPKEPCKCELKQQAVRDRTKAINNKILADGKVKEALEELRKAFQNQEKAAQEVAAADRLVEQRSQW